MNTPGGVAQSVRALPCQGRGRGFKSRHRRQNGSYLKSLPRPRPEILPTARLATRLPTVPRFTAFKSPSIRAARYRLLRVLLMFKTTSLETSAAGRRRSEKRLSAEQDAGKYVAHSADEQGAEQAGALPVMRGSTPQAGDEHRAQKDADPPCA